MVSVACGPRIKKVQRKQTTHHQCMRSNVLRSSVSFRCMRVAAGAGAVRALLFAHADRSGLMALFPPVVFFLYLSYQIAMMNIKVYALAVYVERSDRARAAVKPAMGGPPDKAAGALLSQDPAAFFPRALHMIFARSVSGQQVRDEATQASKQAKR
jgi:hypothetical protein